MKRATLRVRHSVLEASNREPLRNAAAPVDLLLLARQERDFLHHFADVGRHDCLHEVALGPCFLLSNRNSLLQRDRIVGANLRTYAVLQWSDNLSARRVILGI